ncbi:MAG TPA: GNAT family N-acetyltransferase, partial [Chloroflexota bacterium]
HWGGEIARVREDTLTPELVDRIDSWCCKRDINCLYFLGRCDDAVTTELADDHGYRLVDVRVTLQTHTSGAVGGEEKETVGGTIRAVRVTDVDPLQRLASASHHDTRFYYDAHFPRTLCDSLYATWIRRSCEGYADQVLVGEMDGQTVGYISCHLDAVTHRGSIGLVGVSDHVQGKGMGKRLVHSAMQWFVGHGAESVSVVTQGRNIPAQRLYQGCGFKTHNVQLWYHKWYRPLEMTI